MVHLRIVAPPDRSQQVVELLEAAASTTNLVLLEGAARQPRGDVVLCDVAREDASVVIDDLKRLGVHRDGSIALEQIDGTFLAFMALACLSASVGIFTGSPILIVGAMVVGPEFGPLAGLCVAVVERRDADWEADS